MSGRFSLRSMVSILGLIIRVPGWRIQWSSSYKRARGEFRRQLMAQGVPEAEARKLAELYPFRMGDLIEAVRGV